MKCTPLILRAIVGVFMAMSIHTFAQAEPDCKKVETICIAGVESDPFFKAGVTTVMPCRAFDGDSICLSDVGRTCWGKRHTYECRSAETVNDCQPLRDQGCSQIGSTCIADVEGGQCATYEQTYQCPDKAESVTEKTVCDTSTFCQDNGVGCFDTSSKPDSDFGKAAAMMEVARQAGVYGADLDSVELFKGYSEKCSVKVLGGKTIKSCCKASGGGSAYTNNAVMGAGLGIVAEGASEVLRTGSMYVYDSLYHVVDSGIMQRGIDALDTWGRGLGDGTFNPTMNVYGFSFQFSFANGLQFTGFDPYSFAFSVAMQVVTEWLSCEPEEQTMALKRGQGLCVHIGTRCSKKVLGVCVERQQEHCCFNSKLAKIINRQGRAQIGMPMNACGGFTQQQLESLDFSQLDLTEFIADITPKDVSPSKISDRVQQTVNEKIQSYYDQ